MKIKNFGYLVLIMGILIAGFVPVAYTLGNNLSAIQLMFFVSLVGTVVSGALMLATNTQKNLSGILKNRTQFLSLTITALFMFTFLELILSVATHYISASLVSVVYRTWPLILILIAPFIIGERVSRWDLLALLIGFSSLAIVLIGNTPFSLPVYVIPFVALVLVGALCDATATALQKRYSYDLNSSIFFYNLVALVAFTALAIYYNVLTIAGITAVDIFAILFLGIVQNVGLAFAYINAVRILKTAFVGNIYNLVPFITMGFAVVILAQPVQPAYIIVAIGVLVGVTIQRLAPKGTNYIAKKRDYAPTIYDVTSAFVNTKNTAIYDVMKGSGRVLAFFKSSPDGFNHNLSSYSDNSCMIITNKSSAADVAKDEFEFIKEILGHAEDDLLVLGIGEPNAVEERFSTINKDLETR